MIIKSYVIIDRFIEFSQMSHICLKGFYRSIINTFLPQGILCVITLSNLRLKL